MTVANQKFQGPSANVGVPIKQGKTARNEAFSLVFVHVLFSALEFTAPVLCTFLYANIKE